MFRLIWRNLEAGALVCHPPDPIHRHLDLLLPDGVVTSCIVVGDILLAGDQLLGVEQLAIGSSPNLIYKILRVHSRLSVDPHYLVHYGGFQVDKDSPGHMLP